MALGVTVAAVACGDFLLQPQTPLHAPHAIQLSAPQLTLDEDASVTLTATVLDETGQPLTELPAGAHVAWRSSADSVSSVDDTGLVTGHWPGHATVTASVAGAGVEIGVSAAVTVAAVPTSLSVAAGDSQIGSVGARLARDLAARVTDRHGLGVAGVAVNFALSGGHARLVAAADTTDSAGVAAVALTLDTLTGPVTVDATSPRLPGATAHFTAQAVAGAPSRLAFVVQPAAVAAGEPITPAVQIAARDSFGNVAATLPGPVTISLGAAPAGAALTGTTKADLVDGVASFADLRVTPAGTGYTLVASASGLAGATSVAFDVGGGALPAIALDIAGSNVIGLHRTSTLDITLAAPAPAGGVTVSVTSDDASIVSVAAPGTVAIPAGGTAGQIALSGAAEGTATVRASAVGYAPAALSVQVTNQALAVAPVPLSTGMAHTCIVATAGRLMCWGDNSAGQFGDGTRVSRSTPSPAGGGGSYVAVTAGGSHSCALTAAGTAYCWGDNSSGQLGDGTSASSTTPVAVAGGLQWARIVAAAGFTCGLTTAGAAYCWGGSGNGRLGDGTNLSHTQPTAVAGTLTFVALSAFADNHVCALTAGGAAWCWGYNYDGELGDGTMTSRLAPTAVIGGKTYTTVASAWFHTCALDAAGAAWCWGDNNTMQLGYGTPPQDSYQPGAVQGGHTFTSLSAGGGQTCGLDATGAAWCWGYNGYGALGDGTTTWRLTPVAVAGGLFFSRVSVGNAFACALTPASELYCWGLNSQGQLGDGTTTNRLTPVPISLNPATQLAFTVQPGASVTGTAITPAVRVEARDASGSLVAGYTGTVSIALGSNPGGASLGGTASVAAAQGVATFEDLTVSAAGAGYTLVASAPGLAAATSASFDVTAPAPARTVSWANAAGGDWSTPANWSTGTVPGPSDTAVITLAGVYTVKWSGSLASSLARLVVGDSTGGQVTLALSGVALTADGGVAVLRGGVLDLAGSSIAGAGGIANEGTVVLRETGAGASSTLATAVDLNWGALIVRGTNAVTGVLTTTSGSSIEIGDDGTSGSGSAILSVATGFTNVGDITLTNEDPAAPHLAELRVESGTLANPEAGKINSEPGLNGGARVLDAVLDNGYHINVDYPLTITRPDAAGPSVVQRNGGQIYVTGGDLTLDGSAAAGYATEFDNWQLLIGGGYTVLVTPQVLFVNSAGGTVSGAGYLVSAGQSVQSRGGQWVPGSWGSSGYLEVDAPGLSLDGGSTVAIDVGGRRAGSGYDQMVVDGTLTIGVSGTLSVSLINGFAPSVGDTFAVLTYAARQGSFSAINLPGAVNQVALIADSTPTALVLRAVSVAPVATVEVTPAAITLAYNALQQLTATPKDAVGNVLIQRTVTWSSSNVNVANVDSSGLVQATGVGTATITATVEGVVGTSSVTVTP